MRKIIWYIRSCFCKHELKFLRQVNIYDEFSGDMPSQIKHIYICPKCGFVKKIKF